MNILAQAIDSIPLDPHVLTAVGTTLITAVAGAFGLMWRQAVAESKAKNDLLKQLADQQGRTTEALLTLVSLHEGERRNR